MTTFKKTLISACLVIFLSTSYATPKVVSSIYPLQQIANAIVGGKTDLVTDSYLSPHDYTVKPKDASKVLNADLFIWVNDMIVPQLHTYVERRSDKHKITITAGKIADMQLLKLFENKRYNHNEKRDEHGGHQHDHSKIAYDPHIWLSTHNAKTIGTEIAKKLSQIDSENTTLYQKNLKQFIINVDATKAEIAASFNAHPVKPYFIFHDAYHYFENEFGISHTDTIRAHAGQGPRTKHIIDLEQKLQTNGSACLFREPQFNSPLVDQLVANSKVTVSVLDPIGYQKEKVDIEGGYNTILKNIANQLQICGK